uniref:Uncharacterized protein n=1 Tax=Cannabis sativa TaxID=3483 RepID=A0A803P3P5_CANSA
MVGILPKVMCHRLNIDPDVRGVQQKHRKLDPVRKSKVSIWNHNWMGRDGVECNGYHQSDVQREHFYGGSYDGVGGWEFTLKRAYWDLNAARFSVRDDTFCHIWKAKIHDRNEIFHNSVPLVLSVFRDAVENSFQEHCTLLGFGNVNSENYGGTEVVRWGLPRPGRVKCFVDYASSIDDGAVAAVIFDEAGFAKCFGAVKV